MCTQDMKNGGTPLHWASSREVLESLIQRGCYINSLDFNGRTALHVMVSKNRLECIVSLLAHEAEIDLKDKDGNTALHIAVEKKLIPIVQCLVVFGCDIDTKNKHEQSSRHMVNTNKLLVVSLLIAVIKGRKRCIGYKRRHDTLHSAFSWSEKMPGIECEMSVGVQCQGNL